MVQVIYASAATEPFSAEQLRTLLTRARARNDLYQVSGILVYHQGSFLQVLEGPEEGVETILASVYKDKRHYNERTLLRQAVAQREFDRWSMAFVDTRASSFGSPAGMLDYSRDLTSSGQAASKAKQYLRHFQLGLCRQAG